VNAQLIDGVEEFADMRVHFRECIGKVAKAGLAGESRVGERRKMHLRIRDVGIERPASTDAAFHEIDRPAGNFGVNQPALVEIVNRNGAALFALAAFHDRLERRASGLGRRIAGPEGLVGCARNAVPLVEALVVRQSPVGTAEMPFAEMPGGTANAGQ
jgi:hypothetical protein